VASILVLPLAVIVSMHVAHRISDWMYRNRYDLRYYDEAKLQAMTDWQHMLDDLTAAIAADLPPVQSTPPPRPLADDEPTTSRP
jgi:hypothetical protein